MKAWGLLYGVWSSHWKGGETKQLRKMLAGQLQENEKNVAYSGKKKVLKKRHLGTRQNSLLICNLRKFNTTRKNCRYLQRMKFWGSWVVLNNFLNWVCLQRSRRCQQIKNEYGWAPSSILRGTLYPYTIVFDWLVGFKDVAIFLFM